MREPNRDIGVIVRFDDGTEKVLDTGVWVGDEALPPIVQYRAILRALRLIFNVPEGASVIESAALMCRRYNELRKKYNEYPDHS